MKRDDAPDYTEKPSLGILERLKRATIIEVAYPRERGTIGLRGSAPPLSWTTTTTPPTATLGDRSVFELAIADGEMVDVKIVRGNDWAHGRNYTLHAGDHLHLRPAFERTTCRLMPPVVLPTSPWPLRYQVLLPPSYDEQSSRHYPVLYAQDGQALWSSSSDPFGIVVGIDTSERRTYEEGTS